MINYPGSVKQKYGGANTWNIDYFIDLRENGIQDIVPM